MIPTIRDTPVDEQLCTLDNYIDICRSDVPPWHTLMMRRSVSPVKNTAKALARLWRTELKDENGHSKPLKDNGVYMVMMIVYCLWLRTVD
jgi:hypothetical protein